MKPLTPSQLDLGHASVLFRPARAEEVYPLRMLVLIAGTDRTSPEFSGDRDPHTLHIVGEIDGEIVTAASWMASEWEGEPAYQLRGMATAPGWQRRGLGKNLLVYSENSIADLGVGSIIWCNARLGALDFYLRQGWTRASEVFEIPGVGPHYRLSKTLAKKPLADATS